MSEVEKSARSRSPNRQPPTRGTGTKLNSEASTSDRGIPRSQGSSTPADTKRPRGEAEREGSQGKFETSWLKPQSSTFRRTSVEQRGPAASTAVDGSISSSKQSLLEKRKGGSRDDDLEGRPKKNARTTDSSIVETTDSRSIEVPELGTLRGMINWRFACFSSAVLQFLNTALSPEQIAGIRGIEPLLLLDKAEYAKLLELDSRWNSGQMVRVYKSLQQNIMTIKNVNKCAYLGQVLIDLRKGVMNKSDTYVSPFLCQQVFAHCDNDFPSRFDGSSQEDASEYLATLGRYLREHAVLPYNVFMIAFEDELVCTNPGCGYRSKLPTAKRHELFTSFGRGKTTDFASMVQDALNNSDQEPRTCDGCNTGGSLVVRRTSVVTPEKLIVMIQRDDDTRTTAIAFPTGEMDINGELFTIDAIVLHHGPDMQRGHYICKVVLNGRHHVIDDKRVRTRQTGHQDGLDGYASIVLLSKKQPPTQT